MNKTSLALIAIGVTFSVVSCGDANNDIDPNAIVSNKENSSFNEDFLSSNDNEGGPYYDEIYPEYCEVVSPKALSGIECDYLVQSVPYQEPAYLLQVAIQDYPSEYLDDVGVLGISIRPTDNRATFTAGKYPVTGLSFYQAEKATEYPKVAYEMPFGTMVHINEMNSFSDGLPSVVTHVFHHAELDITHADAIAFEDEEQNRCELLQLQGECGRQYVKGTASLKISTLDKIDTAETIIFKFASYVDWHDQNQ
ncbi:hypothetical protein [Kangiella sp. HZ709]|uniref:hypothetical protein n=1 Tax=Kangiella sp. HZ709 TaxID=2666328 RepID=UPI0012AF5F8C|nr:hypothetical protein [Kangiella sp. HZ709]MRX26809.1 hypothetical protein [Kangiella sp. HZ709]